MISFIEEWYSFEEDMKHRMKRDTSSIFSDFGDKIIPIKPKGTFYKIVIRSEIINGSVYIDRKI